MIIRSKNFVLKLEEILKDRLPTERYNEHEKFVLKIIRQWHSNTQSFTHQTSGSTGRPKKIQISREKIEISTKATFSFIDPEGKMRSSLLCLNPAHIGGAMVVYRSLIFNHDLTILEPSSNPMSQLTDERFDMVSLVPMQFKKLSTDDIERFRVILIGGAPMEPREVSSKAKIYSTFGMTETVSHIALRPLDDHVFTTTGDTIVSVGDDDTLKIKGSITDHKWLDTNDIATVISNTSFEWIGRKDFIINSGGIKINPEEVEHKLEPLLESDFMIGSVPDDQLGSALVLISSGGEKSLDFSSLDKYHRPKNCYFNQQIFRTASGKLDRRKTQKLFESNQ